MVQDTMFCLENYEDLKTQKLWPYKGKSAPFYLYKLMPTKAVSHFNIGDDFYRNSLLPFIFVEWNKLGPNIWGFSSFNIFKKKLLIFKLKNQIYH